MTRVDGMSRWDWFWWAYNRARRRGFGPIVALRIARQWVATGEITRQRRRALDRRLGR